MLRFETAGESHGECLVATLTGLPSGVPISLERVNRELWRRQQGFGRGGRMKIETDTAHVVSGVRHSKTIGAPIAMIIQNRDWKNWTDSLPVEDFDGSEEKRKRSSALALDTPISPGLSSTISPMPATSSNAPALAKPRPVWPSVPSAKSSSASSA